MKTSVISDENLFVKEQLSIYYPNWNINQNYDNNFFYEEYLKLDKVFKTRFDYSYQRLVNFSQTKNLPIHRWFYYQEGYSPVLVNRLLDYLNVNKSNSFLFDPFAGSGTSLLAAKNLNMECAGVEINPFSYYMGVAKTQNYLKEELDQAENFKIPEFINLIDVHKKYELSIIEKLFDEESLIKIELLKQNISLEKKDKTRQILFTALLCILQQVSYYKKAGNGLKKKRIYSFIDVFTAYDFKLKQIIKDLRSCNFEKEPVLINDSCLNLKNININEIDISVFSPPYPNCFDYYEVYKIELWLGEFVKTYKELSGLRKAALTSNLNANLKQKNSIITSSKLFYPIIDYLQSQQLWDNKIPKMLISYFYEMSKVLNVLFDKTKLGGYCVIVVGNSSYSGLAIPTDIILAEIGKSLGFKVKEIIVARKNETSSQQYKKIGHLIEYIRESIVILQKT